MKTTDLVSKDLILPQIRASHSLDVIKELGSFLAEHYPGVNETEAIRVLAERERVSSTAVGEGLAIPHAKLDSVRQIIACLGRSRRGIDFGSPDGKPTHFFFVLIAPESGTPGDHLKTLARISRLFKDGVFRTRLMAARTAHEIHEILVAEEA